MAMVQKTVVVGVFPSEEQARKAIDVLRRAGYSNDEIGFLARVRPADPTGAVAADAASGMIGSPATIRETLRRYEESGVDQVILLNQAGRTTHEDICASLDLFAREVMPEFQGREPEHQAWKQQMLAGDVELEDLETGAPVYIGQPLEHLDRLTPEKVSTGAATVTVQ